MTTTQTDGFNCPFSTESHEVRSCIIFYVVSLQFRAWRREVCPLPPPTSRPRDPRHHGSTRCGSPGTAANSSLGVLSSCRSTTEIKLVTPIRILHGLSSVTAHPPQRLNSSHRLTGTNRNLNHFSVFNIHIQSSVYASYMYTLTNKFCYCCFMF